MTSTLGRSRRKRDAIVLVLGVDRLSSASKGRLITFLRPGNNYTQMDHAISSALRNSSVTRAFREKKRKGKIPATKLYRRRDQSAMIFHARQHTICTRAIFFDVRYRCHRESILFLYTYNNNNRDWTRNPWNRKLDGKWYLTR